MDVWDSMDVRLPVHERTPIVGRLLRAQIEGDSAARSRALAELRETNVDEKLTAVRVSSQRGDYDAAERVEAFIPAKERTQLAERLSLGNAIAQGRWSAARPFIEQARKNQPTYREHIRLVALFPFLPVPAAEVAAMRKSVEQADSVPAPGSDEPGNLLRAQDRHYLLGALSCRLGEHDVALAHARAIEASSVPPEWKQTVTDLSTQLRAEVAARQGRPEEALRLFDSMDPTPPKAFLQSGLSARRFWEAELRYQLGQDDEAIRWYKNAFATQFYYELMSSGYIHLRLGELYDRKGERDLAIEHYAKALKHWPNPDVELKAQIDRARQRLSALTGER
jgi:tetratricopeptide (TPR) repeat protein